MIKILSQKELNLYGDHLLRLNEHDRHLRFGCMITDGAILNHVHASDPTKRAILASCNDEGEVIAACEVCFIPYKGSTRAEIGVSVNDGYRGHGLGSALFKRAVDICQQRQIHSLVSYCAAHNTFMMRIARTQGMTIEVQYGETEATLKF